MSRHYPARDDTKFFPDTCTCGWKAPSAREHEAWQKLCGHMAKENAVEVQREDAARRATTHKVEYVRSAGQNWDS